MITPDNRKQFERHIHILAESIEQGTFKSLPDHKIIMSLLKTKKLPNKRVNFITVDERSRSLANSLANFDRPEFKNSRDAR
ncbi:hypothetical protein CQ046_15815 [Chryseobacterium sp. MYb7]|uniref:AVAST type 1 anti-phage system protein Avs1c n=1 Tax=Chryseobacterium sp. MYb7 TaxID=1827290 RepID=UPI000CFFBB55|nr:AVAST type 1 anti-phage system protein Avs1c [Chryseobacterium sp. MYb7]PRB01343.1 hypothetical protein CQ046_15815 [Chryseobacterium sp. MYb7]